jgi:hypothetical protein
MAANYTLEGNVLLVKQELTNLVRDHLKDAGAAPAHSELLDWAGEEVNTLSLSSAELAEAIDKVWYTEIANLIPDKGITYTSIKDLVERAYRQELSDKVTAWAEDFWMVLCLAEVAASDVYVCADCGRDVDFEGQECDDCSGEGVAADIEQFVDFDEILAADVEDDRLRRASAWTKSDLQGLIKSVGRDGFLDWVANTKR